MFRLIVFDLDGTLVDSRRDIADATNRLIAEYGGARLDQDRIVRMVGEGVTLLVERAMTASGIAPVPEGAVNRFTEIYGRALLVHTRPYPGIREALGRLSRSATLAVLTNKPEAASRAILDGLGLAPYFWRVFGGDGPWGRKPDAEALGRLIVDAGTTREAAVLVGDSVIDLETARNARVRICLARYGFGYAKVTADRLDGTELIVDSPAELPSVLGAERDERKDRGLEPHAG